MILLPLLLPLVRLDEYKPRRMAGSFNSLIDVKAVGLKALNPWG